MSKHDCIAECWLGGDHPGREHPESWEQLRRAVRFVVESWPDLDSIPDNWLIVDNDEDVLVDVADEPSAIVHTAITVWYRRDQDDRNHDEDDDEDPERLSWRRSLNNCWAYLAYLIPTHVLSSMDPMSEEEVAEAIRSAARAFLRGA